TRFGPRLQVWLQRPVGETTVQLTGWLPRSPKEPAQFNLPLVRVADMKRAKTTVRLSGEGLVLTPGKMQNLTARPELRAPGADLVFEGEQDVYGGPVQTSPAVASADFRLLTFAEVQERDLRVTATLRGTVRQGELRNLLVTVRNWDGGELTLTAP